MCAARLCIHSAYADIIAAAELLLCTPLCHYQCEQLLEALVAAFASCTVPDHTDDTPAAASNATSATATAGSDDDTSTDVDAHSNSSDGASSRAKHSADAPIVTVKPEKAKVSSRLYTTYAHFTTQLICVLVGVHLRL
jgi:hypothetical protein